MAVVEKSFRVVEHGGIDPAEESPRFVAKHLSAYHFASPFAHGSVLEIGFGDGYGASLLADKATQVLGVDLFEANVKKARLKYPKPNLQFIQMSGTDLRLDENSFDLVVSFQVIEHVPQDLLPRYVDEIKRVLKPGGIACISTLNLKKNKKPGKPYHKSPHHDKEFTPDELRNFLEPFFKTVKLYGLYPTPKHSLFERIKKAGILKGVPAHWNPITRYYQNIRVSDFRWLHKFCVDDCVDIMAVCHG